MRTEHLRNVLSETVRFAPMTSDIDQVVAHTLVTAVEKFNKIFGANKSLKNFKGWNTFQDWSREYGLSEKEAVEMDRKIWTDPEVYWNAPIVPGAKALSRRFYEIGFKLPYITTRFPELAEVTYEWFKKELPWVSQDQIYIRKQDEQEIPATIYKGKMVGKLGAAIHLEDAVDHALAVLEMTTAMVYLVPYPYNRTEENPRLKQFVMEKKPNLWCVLRSLSQNHS